MKKYRKLMLAGGLVVALGLWLTATLGCGASAAGVSVGGAQDIGLARQQIAMGQIPDPSSFVVEGLLSEHDIDIEAPACEEIFCLATATGVEQAADTGRDAAFVVLGMSSGIDLETFQRRPQNIAVVVDRSGSMSGGKIEAAREALRRLVAQLGPEDRLAIVQFDTTVSTVVRSRRVGAGRGTILRRINRIRPRGGTDMDAGLRAGYRAVRRHSTRHRADRVILITDALPNSGRTSTGGFLDLAREHAAAGVGLTVFGVGVDFGQELGRAIGEVPGGNYFFLQTPERLRTVFDEDFNLLVTPVAWDLDVVVRPAAGYRIAAAYGIPGDGLSGNGSEARIRVPTLFLSRNRGAIVLRLEPTGTQAEQGGGWDGSLARTMLSYRRELHADPVDFQGSVEVPATGPNAGVTRAVRLVNTALALQTASRLARAGEGRDAFLLLDQLQTQLQDPALERERAMVAELQAIIENHLEPRS